MKIPAEFDQFTKWFFQGLNKAFPDPEAFIQKQANKLDPEARMVIRNFLDELLSGKYSEEELDAIWRSTSADMSPIMDEKDAYKDFFTHMRAMFED